MGHEKTVFAVFLILVLCIMGVQNQGNSCDNGNVAGDDNQGKNCKTACTNITAPTNGALSNTNFSINQIVEFTCNENYTLVGAANITCSDKAKWSAAVPTCVAGCLTPVAPTDGSVDTSGGLLTGATITYSCNSGYRLQGSSSATCTNTGVTLDWNSAAPTCVKECPTIGSLSDGGVTVSDNITGSMATFSCNGGTTLVGANSVTCQASGQWSPAIPTCISNCPTPVAPTNGAVDTSNGIYEGQTITFTCDPNYTLQGDATAVCSSSIQWSNPAPTCLRNCPEPSSPPNGNVVSNGNIEGTTATYSCDSGYTLSGSATVTCLATGSYSGSPPTCLKNCSEPSSPANGNVVSNGNIEGTTATYSCDSGYTLSGSATVTCLATGLYSGSPPTCLKNCSEPSSPANGNVVSNGNIEGTTATYSCNSGYTLSGSATVTCLATGSYSGSPPTCLKNCSEPSSPANGNVVSNGNIEGTTATYSCNSGYTLSGSATVTCLATGSYSGSPPTCLKNCSEPSSPANGNVVSNGNIEGTTATYSCDSGYTLSGSATVTCLATGSYSGSPPTCLKNCSEPSSPANGNVVSNGNIEGTTATYSCDSGYTLSGSATVTCLATGSYSGSPPTCLKNCSEPNSPANGNVVSNGNIEGTTATYSCNSGYTLSGSATVTCLATGSYSGSPPTCLKNCSEPSSPANGNVVSNGNIEGTTATYSCDSGYTLSGSATVTCLATGSYSGSPPTCLKNCSEPSSPANGNVVSNGNIEGTTATYSCDSGYTLSGSATVTCLATGSYSGSPPTCLKNCSEPSSPANGNVVSNGNIEGTTATYSCDSGYTLSGSATVTCLATGSYSGSPPTCLKNCPEPSSPANGNVVSNGNIEGTTATYSCDSGYTLSGSATVTCLATGSYSGSPPTCIKNCSEPSSPANGNVVSNGNIEGTTATYSCDSGYTLSGSATVTCLATGSYSESPPICLKNCSEPSSPANGNVVSNGNIEGTTATYSCDSGYTLSGSATVTCLATGSYSGSPPTCLKNCPEPSSPANGNVVSNGNIEGTTATYSCDSGYTLSGSATVTCLATGSYSGSPPTCLKNCSEPSSPANGNVVSNGNIEGTSATYSCDSGYTLSGSATVTCLATGSYSGSPPTCLKNCSEPSSPANGNVVSNGNIEGTTATYSCDSGYTLSGSAIVTCLATGSYSGSPPTCLKNCSEPSSVANGNVVSNGNIEGTTATYSCDSGYTLSGSATVTCLATGSYSGSPPTCLKNCPEPSSPANGNVVSNGNIEGTTATYSCDSGYTLSGSATVTCLATGSYSGSPPTCLKNCSEPSSPANGNVVSNGNIEGTTATYSCDNGYTLSGSATVTCLATGSYSGSPPTCLKNCPEPSSPANGNVVSNGNVEGTTATYSCDSGYTVSGSATVTCLATGSYSGSPPTCLKNCPEPSSPANGNVVSNGNIEGTTATYSCDSGYTLSGSATVTCLATGSYSGSPPTCLKNCPEPSSPSNGNVVSNGNIEGTTATYSCENGYTLSGSATVTCLATGSYSGLPPTCLKNCPEPSSPANGNVVSNGNIEGTTAIYSCDSGYTLSGSATVTCLATGSYSGSPPTCLKNCPTLLSPSHGTIDLTNGTFEGRTITYNCDPGYSTQDDTRRTCQSNGQWSGSPPTCVEDITECQSIGTPGNGTTDVSGRIVGTVATFTCDSGYTLNGSPTSRCLTSGLWSDPVPDCVKDCPNPADPANGNVDTSNGLSVGTTITYSCSAGYKLVGDTVSTCLSSTSWSKTAPTCVRECSQLSNPANGAVSSTDNTQGSQATFTCSSGYIRVGASTVTCQSTGQWTDSPPTCLKKCSSLPALDNGSVNPTGDSYDGQSATLNCDPGYTLVGSSIRTCQSDGTWSNSQPICAKECSSLPALDNGSVNPTGDSYDGQSVMLTCNPGYTLVGSSVRTCQSDGTWSNSQPTCVKECTSLSNPVNGLVSATSNTSGSTAMFTCSPDYHLVGSSSTTCQPTGLWTTASPVCRRKCSSLPALDNGSINPTGDSYDGQSATLTCYPGYTLFGSSIRTCQSDGTWTNSQPTCVKECTSLSNPVNGLVSATGNTSGSTATFSCSNDYQLVGPSSTICQSTGSWTTASPVCLRKCSSLPSLENGSVNSTGDSYDGQSATFTCNPGYILVGSSVRTCQSDGTWNNTQPTCVKVTTQCSPLAAPSNGDVTVNSRLVGAQAIFSCNTGFSLVGSSSLLTCLSTGSWSGSVPTCIQNCPSRTAPVNGNIDTSNGIYIGQTITFTCKTGYSLDGVSTATCLSNGKWSSTTPSCVIECSSLSDPANGKVSAPGNTSGTTATFNCDSGYTLVGSKSTTCQSTGQWTSPKPTCLRNCPSLSSPDNGSVNTTGVNYAGQTAEITCNTGYTLDGSSTRTCQSDGTWSGSNPTCVKVDIQCSPLANPTDGDVTVNSRLVGAQANFSCNSGFSLVGSSTLTCLGSGSWSGSAPTCIQNCASPTAPVNGNIDMSNGIFIGQSITYTCEPGYKLNGFSTATCLNTLKWSSNPPVCTKECNSFDDPINGMVSATGNTSGSTAMFTCNSGYTLVGSKSSTCQSTGNWTSSKPVCLRNCPKLSEPDNGSVDTSGVYYDGQTVGYTCNVGYGLVGSSTRTCQSNGTWSGSQPTCVKVATQCSALAGPSDGDVTVNSRLVGAQANYSCDTGFSLVGSPTLTCLSSGSWSGSTPTCIQNCANRAAPENGIIDTSNGLYIGQTITYTCNTGYKLEGSSTATCLSTGKWSSTAPTCVRICPTLTAPAGGSIVIGDRTVSSKARFDCDQNYRLVGQSTLTCQADGTWDHAVPICRIKCPTLNLTNGNVQETGDTASFTCDEGFLLVGETKTDCLTNGKWSDPVPACTNAQSTPESFVAPPKIQFQMQLPSGTDIQEARQEVLSKVLNNSNELQGVNITSIQITKLPNGSFEVELILDAVRLNDEKITDIGRDIKKKLKDVNEANTTTTVDPVASFYVGAIGAVPINTSCFWYVNQERCVNKGLCVKDENRQKCLCEETPCTGSLNLGIMAIPAALIFTMLLLLFGGCRTHCGHMAPPKTIYDGSDLSTEYVSVPVEKTLIGVVRQEYSISPPNSFISERL